MALTQRVDRIMERFLKTDVGREAVRIIGSEDLEARRQHATALVEARAWLKAELERLEAPRRVAAEKFERTRAVFEEARLAFDEIERQIRWTKFEAEHRAGVATRRLRASAPEAIDRTLEALRDLEVAVRRELHVWEQQVGWLDPKTLTTTNATEIQTATAEIREAIARVEALALEALEPDELDARLAQVRADVEAALRRNDIPLAWPVRA